MIISEYVVLSLETENKNLESNNYCLAIAKMKKFTRHSWFSTLCHVQYHVALICVYSILIVLYFPSLIRLFIDLSYLINID